ncbi:uncharacterized protein [Panulirus ornatus]|uniref:uncharacterized protein n=1 Tax=Panulirus ornatus TaxID=150431 RepID=UPI003A8588F4
MAAGKAWKSPVARRLDVGMECTRCRSRHAAHRISQDSEDDLLPGRGRVRGRDRAHVIREGVSRWTFPARTPARPLPSMRAWQRSHPWSLQLQHARDYSIPDMEGVVSDELRHRIERVLSFPIGRHQGDLSTTETTPSTPIEDRRCPAGGLLQEYLDQLGPEGEEDDELVFQGSESDDSDADLLYDPEKETYTTPYLLYLQQPRAKRAEQPAFQDAALLQGNTCKLEDEGDEHGTPGRGREGAMGRSGYRSSVPTSSRTPTNNKELPTSSASNSKEPPTSASNSKEPPTSASNSKGPPTSASDLEQLQTLSLHRRRPSADQGGLTAERDAVGAEAPEDPTGLCEEPNDELLTEEDDNDGGTAAADPNRKKRKKKKKRRRRKSNAHREMAEEEVETEEELQKAKLEDLKKSIALSLFRDFAKNVFARDHPDFQLFDGFEDLDRSKYLNVPKAGAGALK